MNCTPVMPGDLSITGNHSGPALLLGSRLPISEESIERSTRPGIPSERAYCELVPSTRRTSASVVSPLLTNSRADSANVETSSPECISSERL